MGAGSYDDMKIGCQSDRKVSRSSLKNSPKATDPAYPRQRKSLFSTASMRFFATLRGLDVVFAIDGFARKSLSGHPV
jgi:hypothetical protein